MIVQELTRASSPYIRTPQTTSATQEAPAAMPASGDPVSISEEARQLSASGAQANDREVQDRLAAIKAKPAVQRTQADRDFLNRNDTRLKDIQARLAASGQGPESLKADDLEYMQVASGMVNTMGNLTQQERQLYDQLVSSGNQEAAQGLRMVALARVGQQGSVTLPDGRNLDLRAELSSYSVRNLYSQMFADSDGSIGRAFNALAQALDQRSTAAAKATA